MTTHHGCHFTAAYHIYLEFHSINRDPSQIFQVQIISCITWELLLRLDLVTGSAWAHYYLGWASWTFMGLWVVSEVCLWVITCRITAFVVNTVMRFWFYPKGTVMCVQITHTIVCRVYSQEKQNKKGSFQCSPVCLGEYTTRTLHK